MKKETHAHDTQDGLEALAIFWTEAEAHAFWSGIASAGNRDLALRVLLREEFGRWILYDPGE
tara:strand:+ start:887 stop:1072 length:186 start_codon:yes stop_codon:yes gene_type:complete